MFFEYKKIEIIKEEKDLKTFNYESNCVKYRDCFFDMGEYEKGKISLSIYGYIENDKEVSHISNVTVNVEENLLENQIVIDNYANSNLISFLMDLGIVKGIVGRIGIKLIALPIVELDLNILKQYCYNEEVLRYAS